MSSPTLAFKFIDAFALSPYSGNVAGVVFDADGLTDRQMQLIAREFAAPETTFLLAPTTKNAALRIRWFSPGCEINFCGHATLAPVHGLMEEGRFVRELSEPGSVLPIESAAGILSVRVEKSGSAPPTIWLDMPHCEPKSRNVPLPAIADRLGVSMNDFDPRIPAIRTQDDDLILAVKSVTHLLGLAPAMGQLAP